MFWNRVQRNSKVFDLLQDHIGTARVVRLILFFPHVLFARKDSWTFGSDDFSSKRLVLACQAAPVLRFRWRVARSPRDATGKNTKKSIYWIWYGHIMICWTLNHPKFSKHKHPFHFFKKQLFSFFLVSAAPIFPYLAGQGFGRKLHSSSEAVLGSEVDQNGWFKMMQRIIF